LYTGAPKLTFTSGLVSSEGVAIGPDGNLYVADGGTGAVLRFNPSSGAFLSTFVVPNSSSKPNGITFGPDNNLYMAWVTRPSMLRSKR
jgi:sugar lactone lactonase YvrE